MQKVPIDKILIQPTVQYSWLKQNGNIEFNLPTTVLAAFQRLWMLYCESGHSQPVAFLQQAEVEPFDLPNNDLLFALYTGASYAMAQSTKFRLTVSRSQMVWVLDN